MEVCIRLGVCHIILNQSTDSVFSAVALDSSLRNTTLKFSSFFSNAHLCTCRATLEIGKTRPAEIQLELISLAPLQRRVERNRQWLH